MSEPSSIKASVYVPGKGKSKLTRMLTFETICDWIKLQGFDDYTTNGLIQLASRYPTQALPSFRKNFNLMIERVRSKRKKEQNDIFNAAEAQRQGKPNEENKETSCEIQEPESTGKDSEGGN